MNIYTAKLSKKNIKNTIGISLISITQAMSGGLVGIYIGMFYTDVLGITAASMGLLLLIARIWDAMNDPVAGLIIDNSPVTRLGKYKPYLLFNNIALGVLTILMFSLPELFLSYKLIYAYVIYFLWSLAYTFMPIVPLVSNMVQSPEDRQIVTSIQRIVILFIGLTASGFIPLTQKFGGGSHGFSIAIAIFMIPLTLLSLLGVLLVTEENHPQHKPNNSKTKIQYKDIFYLFVNNRPMQIFSLYILFSGMIMPFMNATLVYYIKYHFGIDKMTYIMPLAMLGFALGVAISSVIVIFLGRRKVLISAYFLQGIIFILLYFLGSHSFSLMMILFGMINITMGLVITAETTMSIEIMDFTYLQKKQSMSALISCIHLFLSKCQMAIAGASVGFVLSLTGFVANMHITPELSATLSAIGFLIPAIFSIFALIIICLYPIRENHAQEMYKRLKNQRI